MSRRNPPAIPADTTEEVWRLQMAAIARRSVADRFDEWAELNRAVARMEADGIRRRHPDYSDPERHLILRVGASDVELVGGRAEPARITIRVRRTFSCTLGSAKYPGSN